MLLFAWLALADDPTVALPPDAGLPSYTITETDTATLDIDAAIDQAIAARQAGDLAGCRAILDRLAGRVPAPRMPWYLYQRGILAELEWKPQEAVERYREALVLVGDDPTASADVRFRLAQVLEEVGDTGGALEQMRAVEKARGLSVDDALAIALQNGTLAVRENPRRGLPDLEAAIAAAEAAGVHSWLRAKAYYTLIDALLDAADTIELTGGEKRVVRRLTTRAETIATAERQVAALAATQEVEWVLAALVRLGDAYRSLAEALEASPAPRSLTPEQVTIYRAELAERAENLRARARKAWTAGLELAARTGHETPRVTMLKERLGQR